jgi:hypothetical protein
LLLNQFLDDTRLARAGVALRGRVDLRFDALARNGRQLLGAA